MPSNFYESDDNESHFHAQKIKNYKYNTMPKPVVENSTNYHTLTTTYQRSSLPMDNKYFQRSSSKNSRKYNKNKSRPKPLQVENEKYYEHIFPATPKSINKYSYQPTSFNHAEL